MKGFMITPIKKTYDRLMSSESLELNCKEEQKIYIFKIGYFVKLIPIFATFSAVKSEIQ